MKSVYTGLKAEKVDFGAYDLAVTSSVPSTCIEVVANLRSGNVCTNPQDTTLMMWINDNEDQNFSWKDVDETLC